MRFGDLTPGSFDARGVLDIPVRVDAFSETRAVVSWSSDPAATSPYAPDDLNVDLDLIVLDPSGNRITASADRRRGFEIVRFVPQTGGMYRFRLLNVRFDGQVEPYGLAVSQLYDTETASISGPATLPLNRGSAFALSDPYHPGRAYAAAASFSGGSWANALQFGNRSVPLVVDSLTLVSLQPGGAGVFVGYAGDLDSNGDATLTIQLPALAPLIGLDVAQVAITYEAASSTVVGITPSISSRIVP